MSNPSKNIPAPISHMVRRWNDEPGSRSSRAPAFAGAASLFLLRDDGHAADRQRVNGQAAILVKGALLRCEEEFLAGPRGIRIELQDSFDSGIGNGHETRGRTNLRDEPDLQSVLRSDWIAEQQKRKREARQSVLAQICHDGSGRETEAHLGKSQGSVLSDIHEIANNRQAEAESKRVALHFRDADQRRSSQGALEFDEPGGLFTDCANVAARTLAARAENFSVRSNPQHARTRSRRFGAQLGEHGVEHHARHFVSVLNIVPYKSSNGGVTLGN